MGPSTSTGVPSLLSKWTLTAVTGVRSYLVLFPGSKRQSPSHAHTGPRRGGRNCLQKNVTANIYKDWASYKPGTAFSILYAQSSPWHPKVGKNPHFTHKRRLRDGSHGNRPIDRHWCVVGLRSKFRSVHSNHCPVLSKGVSKWKGDCLYWERRHVCETLKSTSLQSEPCTHVNYLAYHHIGTKCFTSETAFKK